MEAMVLLTAQGRSPCNSPMFSSASKRLSVAGGANRALLCGSVFLGALSAIPALAEDSDMFRPYIQVRSAAFNEYWGERDGWGLSLGANVNSYLGFELAFDAFQETVDSPSLGPVSEIAISHLNPEIRLRYP
ncbi:MAG TPA: hypothetical protein VGR78_03575, partial [Verrucomicrobiae bacterium]|nr:hypothetical protein [Verrucomicrobiae bacterium]